MASGIVDHNNSNDSYNMYDVTFFEHQIRTIVTHSEIPVDDWISETESIHRDKLHPLIVGFDIEWRPNRGPRQNNRVATVQLCVERRCLIFQIIHAKTIPQSLVDFLSNENYSFVGVGIHSDLSKLEKFYGLRVCGNVIDLCTLAADKLGRNDLLRAGLKALVREVLTKELHKPKRITMSKWDKFNLTHGQIQYACIDSYASFEIGRVLKNRN
ncbi:Werner Syndrome-like exonuclease [Melia azedarach]|uniref:Werner Syndrome-like exonuclease n=1 Tax=Melia azedarach TaxID=155640 RepID=A0ACC1X7U5_MELAZ|nr:Werner Syndrome-like exonuclease [Melia azedarach]